MKTPNMLTATLLATLLLSSCATTTQTAKTIGIYGPGVLHRPVVVDLDVKGEKVTGTATGSTKDIASVKNLAIADAVNKVKADVLVEPVFQSEGSGSRITVTVTGFPGTYHNFRTATDADRKLLEIGILHTSTVSGGAQTTPVLFKNLLGQ